MASFHDPNGGTIPTGYDTNGNFQNLQFDLSNNLKVVSAPADGAKATFIATATGLVTLASAGILFTLTGSASKTIRLIRVEMSGLATAATTLEFVLNKYSTAATGGTAGTAPTIVPADSNDSATATVATYTAAPTAGTLVGAVRAVKLNLGTTSATCQFMAWDFGNRPGEKALVLRGITQQIGITTSATAAGSSVDVTCFFSEE